MAANDRQVGGNHYKDKEANGIQHWDLAAMLRLDYFQGVITKYVFRWRDKGGIEDLRKAGHYLEKYIEFQTNGYPPEQVMAVIYALDAMYAEPLVSMAQHRSTPEFVCEGFKEGMVLYRCQHPQCREHFHVPYGSTPYAVHQCTHGAGDHANEFDARVRAAGLDHFAAASEELGPVRWDLRVITEQEDGVETVEMRAARLGIDLDENERQLYGVEHACDATAAYVDQARD